MTGKYYHVKPRSSSTRLSYGRSGVGLLEPDDKTELSPSPARTQIMDLAFVNAASTRPAAPVIAVSTPSLIWLKLLFLIGFGIVIYTGCVAFYQGAARIKQDITATINQGVDKLNSAVQAVALNNLGDARTDLITAENLFASAQKEVLSLGQTNLYMSGLAGDHFQIISGQRLIDAGLNMAQGGQLLISTAVPALQYLNAPNQSGPASAARDVLPQIIQIMSASAGNLDKALAKIAKADNLLSSISPNALGPSYAATLQLAQAKAATLHDTVAMADTLAQQLPRALGSPNPRSYLILNQNDNELRPTGGFMGSYSLLTLERGQVKDFQTDDTYRIDGQLVGPGSTEKVIPNANFDPDFPATAKYVSQLYEASGGGTPDGVIAVNTQVMSALLAVIGNIELPDRKLVITPDNFAKVVYGEIQKANTTQNPKAILSELSPILLQRVTSLTRDQLDQLIPLLIDQVAQKNIMLYVRSANLQQVISEVGFSGALHGTAPKQDFLMIVRANMGSTKSSSHIKDDIHQDVSVAADGTITEHLTLTYTHTGTGQPPDGINQDYVRVYLPQGTTAKDVIGYDTANQIITQSAHGKTFFGFYITTNPGETKTVTLDYQLPFTLDAEKGESYSAYIQKQSGTLNTILTATLTAPNAAKELFKGNLTGDVSI